MSWDEDKMFQAIKQVIDNKLSFQEACVLYEVPIGFLHRIVKKVESGDDAKEICKKNKKWEQEIKICLLIIL